MAPRMNSEIVDLGSFQTEYKVPDGQVTQVKAIVLENTNQYEEPKTVTKYKNINPVQYSLDSAISMFKEIKEKELIEGEQKSDLLTIKALAEDLASKLDKKKDSLSLAEIWKNNEKNEKNESIKNPLIAITGYIVTLLEKNDANLNKILVQYSKQSINKSLAQPRI